MSKSNRHLNLVFSINILLLVVLVWTLVAGGAFPAPASAAAQSHGPTGVPNAAAQRQDMIEAMEQVRSSVEALTRRLESGQITVEVSNLDEIELDLPAAR